MFGQPQVRAENSLDLARIVAGPGLVKAVYVRRQTVNPVACPCAGGADGAGLPAPVQLRHLYRLLQHEHQSAAVFGGCAPAVRLRQGVPYTPPLASAAIGHCCTAAACYW